MHHHVKPLRDPRAQIDPAPAYHAVFHQVWPLIDPRLKPGLLFRIKQRRTARSGVIHQTIDPMFIIADDPVTQCLPVHGLCLGRGLTRMTIQNHGDRQNPAYRFRVCIPRRRRTQLVDREIGPGDG